MVERTEPSRLPARVDGVLLLNKPAGMTSNQALQKVKRLLGARKAGHTGSLDPGATGMLPLCFGEATKVCGYLLDADKKYRVTAKLGAATDTADADGKVIETAPVPALDADGWRSVLARFEGDIEQTPPMYSALKKDGKRLYELARKGEVVEREPRPVTIHRLELLEAAGDRLAMRVHCSKGTYVRTLVEDIARAAGTVGHVASLHRESVGGFSDADMVDLPTAAAVARDGPDALRERLLPPDSALADWPAVRIGASEAARFGNGQSVDCQGTGESGLVRVYGPDDVFVGVGECGRDGSLAPRRLFRLAPPGGGR